MSWEPTNLNRVAEYRHIMECKKEEPKAIIVVCAANLTASDQCPNDCRRCFYGGDITIQWTFLKQGYVQYYPNRAAVDQEYEDLSTDYIHKSEAEQAKLTALQDWLCTHNEQGESVA